MKDADSVARLVYNINDVARLTGKSENLIYRRLTESPKKYVVRFARKEGKSWVFNRELVDNAVRAGESIIIPVGSAALIDESNVIRYLFQGSESCGKASS
jgi:hypothetical protein